MRRYSNSINVVGRRAHLAQRMHAAHAPARRVPDGADVHEGEELVGVRQARAQKRLGGRGERVLRHGVDPRREVGREAEAPRVEAGRDEAGDPPVKRSGARHGDRRPLAQPDVPRAAAGGAGGRPHVDALGPERRDELGGLRGCVSSTRGVTEITAARTVRTCASPATSTHDAWSRSSATAWKKALRAGS